MKQAQEDLELLEILRQECFRDDSPEDEHQYQVCEQYHALKRQIENTKG